MYFFPDNYGSLKQSIAFNTLYLHKIAWNGSLSSGLSRRQQGFESPWGHQVKSVTYNCCYNYRIISGGLLGAFRRKSTI